MARLENYILRKGYNPNTIECAFGQIYDDDRFVDGDEIQTSRIVEHTEKYIKTKSDSIYCLGTPHEVTSNKSDYRLYLLKNGSDAIHKMGNIKRDEFDAELIIVKSEDADYYIGNFAEGFGFIDVKFRKEDCRKATLEELTLCDNGKMSEIVF